MRTTQEQIENELDAIEVLAQTDKCSFDTFVITRAIGALTLAVMALTEQLDDR